ncbi:MAG: uracil-DNA glycosylase family protein, partial [Actinomycetota bacterium]
DPQADEIENCSGFLKRQLSIIKPDVVCTLGNFATRLLSGKPDGITRVHGSTMQFSKAWGDGLLFPVFHPAAALYTPANLEALARDFDSLAGILGVEDAGGPWSNEAPDSPASEETDDMSFEGAGEQLGLF